LDLLFSHLTNKAQNGNQGSIQAYSLFDRIRATGLNGAFLIIFSLIAGLRAWNPEQPILPGEKPACLFPFGRRISS
jgi:hypothetical protein